MKTATETAKLMGPPRWRIKGNQTLPKATNMNTETEKPNEIETAVEAYVADVKLRDKIDYEIRQAFLAGVQYGLKVAQQVYRPKTTE